MQIEDFTIHNMNNYGQNTNYEDIEFSVIESRQCSLQVDIQESFLCNDQAMCIRRKLEERAC